MYITKQSRIVRISISIIMMFLQISVKNSYRWHQNCANWYKSPIQRSIFQKYDYLLGVSGCEFSGTCKHIWKRNNVKGYYIDICRIYKHSSSTTQSELRSYCLISYSNIIIVSAGRHSSKIFMSAGFESNWKKSNWIKETKYFWWRICSSNC